MFGDHFVMCALLIPPLLWWGHGLGWADGLALGLYLNKDFFNGRSLAKRLFKLQVVDAGGLPASELRCFVRNVTFFLWPLEVLVLLMGRHDRLGDGLARTHVWPTPTGAGSDGQEMRAYRFTRYTFFAPFATLAYLLLLQAFSTHILGL